MLTNRIHASKDVDEIMLELAPELCALFEAERFTIYAVEESGGSIVTRVKTGLERGAEHPPADRREQHRRLRRPRAVRW